MLNVISGIWTKTLNIHIISKITGLHDDYSCRVLLSFLVVTRRYDLLIILPPKKIKELKTSYENVPIRGTVRNINIFRQHDIILETSQRGSCDKTRDFNMSLMLL